MPRKRTQRQPVRREDVRSGFEYRVCKDLDERNVPYSYEDTTVEYYKKVNNALCYECGSHHAVRKHTYTPDLRIHRTGILVECKGRFTAPERTKMKAVVESNPHLDIRMLFQEDKYITKNKITTYTEWCEKQGIPYAIEEVPSDWC